MADFSLKMGKLYSERKSSMDVLIQSYGMSLYTLVKSTTAENPSGQIPFNLTKEERKQVFGELDRKFKDLINDYQVMKTTKQGSVNIMAVPVVYLWQILQCETYEELAFRTK